MGYKLMLGCFDPDAVMKSGQIFRMYRLEDRGGTSRFVVYSADRRLTFENQGDEFEFFCSAEEFDACWRRYFDLDRDYQGIVLKAESGNDEFLRQAVRCGSGIRVLNQDVFEMMITFIISQQKQIPSIRKCVEGLCTRFGRYHDEKDEYSPEGWYGFPKPETLAEAGTEGLNGLSLGYRDRYIAETSRRFLTEGISDSEFRALGYEQAKRYLLAFTGIGEKVANCICLFAGGYSDAFPVDTHIKDILYREYYHGTAKFEDLTFHDYDDIIANTFEKYVGARGIVQQWIFSYELSRRNIKLIL